MDNLPNDIVAHTSNMVHAVTTPLQLFALCLIMIFIVIILVIISNIMDKKTKAVVDKETAVRTVKREADLNEIRGNHDRLAKDFAEHITIEHQRYGEDYKSLRESLYDVRELLGIIAHTLHIERKVGGGK